MKKAFIALTAVIVLFAVGCNPETVPGFPGSGDPVQFKIASKSPFSKATDTAFQIGDEIGVFSAFPISRFNVKAIVDDNGGLYFDDPICWWTDQTAATTFAAYYPFCSDKTPDEYNPTPMVLPWRVKDNQREIYDLDGSDLCIAAAENVAVGDVVSFSFVHALAKISMMVNAPDPRLIEKIEVLGTKTDGEVDLVSQSVSVFGSASAITTCHVSSSSPYEVILLPQTADVEILVTMTSGTTYTFPMEDSPFTLEPGKEYWIFINFHSLSSTSLSVDSVTDWNE